MRLSLSEFCPIDWTFFPALAPDNGDVTTVLSVKNVHFSAIVILKRCYMNCCKLRTICTSVPLCHAFVYVCAHTHKHKTYTATEKKYGPQLRNRLNSAKSPHHFSPSRHFPDGGGGGTATSSIPANFGQTQWEVWKVPVVEISARWKKSPSDACDCSRNRILNLNCKPPRVPLQGS